MTDTRSRPGGLSRGNRDDETLDSGGLAHLRRLIAASGLLIITGLPLASLAASPAENAYGDLNAHLRAHGAAVSNANSSAQTGGHLDPYQVLTVARHLLNLQVDFRQPVIFAKIDSGGSTGSGGSGGDYGGNLTTDLFVQQQLSIDNWAPGGSNFPSEFNDRGTLVSQGGNLVVTPTSAYQIGNFNLQTAAINGQYNYVNDLDAPHGAGVHSPFDITAAASGSADNTTDTSEVRVNLQWTGLYAHPDNAYDAPQGGGYPAPIGAVDFFTFDVTGNAAAQYFNPTGVGGSTKQPGLPDLPDLPPLPELDNQYLPNELAGLNPYAPKLPRSPGPDTNNPYNPKRYIDDGYNPYNPSTHTDPGYNPYNPDGYSNSNNPYLASNPYNARGAPDNSAHLAARGGSASNINTPSQFDLTWMTAIEQAQGVRHYLDYGSNSSPESAVFRGLARPVQLTAVNQQELANYMSQTGLTPSAIGSKINVLDSSPSGIQSFASLDSYDERRSGNTPESSYQPDSNPFGYDTRAGANTGSNTSRVSSYQGGTTTTNNPSGYNTSPLFGANNPGGTRIGSLNTATSYDDNSQGNLLSGQSGHTTPAGDVLSYGGATGYDGYDSSAAREAKQAEIDAKRQQDTEANIARMEEERKRKADEAAMQSLTQSALELAKLGSPPKKEVKVGVVPLSQEEEDAALNKALGNTALTIDPNFFDEPDDLEQKEKQDKLNDPIPKDISTNNVGVSESERDKSQGLLDELDDIEKRIDDLEQSIEKDEKQKELTALFRSTPMDQINTIPQEHQLEYLEWLSKQEIVDKPARQQGFVEWVLDEAIGSPILSQGINPFYEGNSWGDIDEYFSGNNLPVQAKNIYKDIFESIAIKGEVDPGEAFLSVLNMAFNPSKDDMRTVYYGDGSTQSEMHFNTPEIDKFIQREEKKALQKLSNESPNIAPGETRIITYDSGIVSHTSSDNYAAAKGADRVVINWEVTRDADGNYTVNKSGQAIRVDEFKDPLDFAENKDGIYKYVTDPYGRISNIGSDPFQFVLTKDL